MSSAEADNEKTNSSMMATVTKSFKSDQKFYDPGLLQAAACDGMIYSVNYNGQNSVTQGHARPLFEDWYNKTIA